MMRKIQSKLGGVTKQSLAVATIVSLGGAAAAQPVIRAIQPPPGSYSYISAYSLSGNGQYVVGEAGDFTSGARDGFRWSSSSGTATKMRTGWPLLATNSDGSVFSGTFYGGGGVGKGAYISRSGVDSNLPDLAGGQSAEVRALSSDGSVAAGRASTLIASQTYSMAARWNSLNQAQSLGDLPDGTKQSIATAMSSDGSLVIGNAATSSGQRGFVWTAGAGMVSLGVVPGYSTTSATAVTADGGTIFGYSTGTVGAPQNNLAFKWTPGGGLEVLPLLSGMNQSTVSDCNADGSVAVGALYQGSTRTAALFTSNGTIAFIPYIQSLGMNLAGWNLSSLLPQFISDDGSVISGSGIYNGQTRPWVISGLPVPTPGVVGVLGLAGMAALRRRR